MTEWNYGNYSTVESDYRYCEHCGLYHAGRCSKIKAIEYYPNGTIKRVEYHDHSYYEMTPNTEEGKGE